MANQEIDKPTLDGDRIRFPANINLETLNQLCQVCDLGYACILKTKEGPYADLELHTGEKATDAKCLQEEVDLKKD
jgi:hypothetical protein